MLAATFALCWPAGAQAWFPGDSEGRIAFDGGVSVPHIFAVNPDGSGERQLTSGAVEDVNPAFSPSGSRIAYAHQVGTTDGAFAIALTSIYSIPAGGGAPTRLTSGKASDDWPAWSPNGLSIIFVRQIGNTANIWTMRADGGFATPLTALPPNTGVVGSTFSPDGTHIVFSAALGGPAVASYRIYEMTSSGGDLHAISPDGTWDLTPDYRSIPSASGGPTGQLIWGLTEPLALREGQFALQTRSATSDFGAYTRFSGATGASPKWSPVVPSDGSERFAYVHANDVYIHPGEQRVTWGAFPYELSWAPGIRLRIPTTLGAAGLVSAPAPGARTVLAFLSCPGAAGRGGCHDRLSILVRSREVAAQTLVLKAGARRTVRLRTNRLRHLIRTSTGLRLLLRQHARGRTLQRGLSVGQAELASSITQACSTSASGAVSDRGLLRLASVGAAAAALRPASGRIVILVARGPQGQVRSVRLTSQPDGSYSIATKIDEPGRWTLVALYAGDRDHAAGRSQSCSIVIPIPTTTPPPGPVATTLTLGCPGQAVIGSAVSVSGAISPAAAGGSVTITYRYQDAQAQTQTITHQVLVSAGGSYSDSAAAIAPGNWTIQASFPGGSGYLASQSPACSTAVFAPTSLSLSCPGKVVVKSALAISGALSPAFAGAPVIVTYSYKDAQNQTQTIADQVTTDAGGNYSDSVTTTAVSSWVVSASFAGDANHLSAHSPACTTVVEQ